MGRSQESVLGHKHCFLSVFPFLAAGNIFMAQMGQNEKWYWGGCAGIPVKVTVSHFTAHKNPSSPVSSPCRWLSKRWQSWTPASCGYKHMALYRVELPNIFIPQLRDPSIFPCHLLQQFRCAWGELWQAIGLSPHLGWDLESLPKHLAALTDAGTLTDGEQYGPWGWLLGKGWTCPGWDLIKGDHVTKIKTEEWLK